MPAIAETRLPGGSVDPSIGADYEHVELVSAARHSGYRRTRRGSAASQLPPAVPAVAKAGLPGGGPDYTCAVGREDIEMVLAAHDRVDRRSGRHANIADRPPTMPAIAEARLPS